MTLKLVQYQRGLADRVFDVFGTSGFTVSEDGRLGWFGPGTSWHANPGDWIYLDGNGNPEVSRDRPVPDPGPRLTAIVPLEARDQIAENVIRLTPESWDQFFQALEAPPRDLRRMRELLAHWDPSWLGTICLACGNLHPITAERISALSTTCDLCGAPIRTYAADDPTLMDETSIEVREVRSQRRDRSPEEEAALRVAVARIREQSIPCSPTDLEEARKVLEASWTETSAADLKEGIREHMRRKHGSLDRFAGRRPMKGDLLHAMCRLLEVPVEVLLPALDLVERTPGPPEVLDEIRCFLGLTVPAGKGWDNPAKLPTFADVVEKTDLARVSRRAVDVLGAPDKAARWLDDPIRALDGRTPREVATTDVERVLAVLTRIAHGVHD